MYTISFTINSMSTGKNINYAHNIKNVQKIWVGELSQYYYQQKYQIPPNYVYSDDSNSTTPYDVRYVTKMLASDTNVTLFAGQWLFPVFECSAIVHLLYTCTDR